MKTKKLFSAVSAFCVVISSVISGGIGTFFNPSSVFAGEVNSLSAGTYCVPLIQKNPKNFSEDLLNSPLHFYGEAVLTIDETGSQHLTIAVIQFL